MHGLVAFFDDEAFFINTMRKEYCNNKDLNGINFYLTGVSDRSVHVVSLRPELWAGTVGGEAMRDWFWRAVTEPDTIAPRPEALADSVTAPGAMAAGETTAPATFGVPTPGLYGTHDEIHAPATVLLNTPVMVSSAL